MKVSGPSIKNWKCEKNKKYCYEPLPPLSSSEREREGGGRQGGREGERERELEPTTLFYKDCSLGSVKNLTTSPC